MDIRLVVYASRVPILHAASSDSRARSGDCCCRWASVGQARTIVVVVVIDMSMWTLHRNMLWLCNLEVKVRVEVLTPRMPHE
jgi:hypothetical protein